MNKFNKNSLDTICRTLTHSMGIKAPKLSNHSNAELNSYIKSIIDKDKIDKIVMFNPDAIAEWIYFKYNDYFKDIIKEGFVEIPLKSVMPPVTPVCFATMYTGTKPSIHGIKKYEKPIITIDSIFDSLIRSKKRVVIIAENDCSMSKIYLNRNMDYFFFDSIDEVNDKAIELIKADKYDFYCIYNGNYDEAMHHYSPEGKEALKELNKNCIDFIKINDTVKNAFKKYNVLIGFAMDHGCHHIDGNMGSHGLKMVEDINIRHLYKVYKKVLK